MKIAIVYDCPVDNPTLFAPRIAKWTESYRQFTPPEPHSVIVCASNGPMNGSVKTTFSGITDRFVVSPHSQWDIGTFQFCSNVDCDMVVFMNARTRFWNAGWLKRFAEVYDTFGPGLYANSASFQACPLTPNRVPNPHIRTCCFATNPKIFHGFPFDVHTREEGFHFESGLMNFAKWYQRQGHPVKMVTWDGIYDMPDWRTPPNIFRKGDQTNCLVYDRHHDIYFEASPDEKKQYERLADGASYDSVYGQITEEEARNHLLGNF